jgi:type VII secretion integral membrane protein EccD
MRPPTADAAYCRLTVLAPRARVDVALPADVPIAELVPMVLELVGEPARGARPEPWRLSGAAGGPLPAAATLGELGVLDGDLLRIAPDAAPPAPPVFDDPVDALAATAGAARAGDRRFRAAAVLAVAVAAGAVLAGVAGPGGTLLATAAAVVAVVHAGRLARRAELRIEGGTAGGTGEDDPLRLAAVTAAVAAVPLAAAAGVAALPGSSAAAQLLLAVVAAGSTAAAAQIVLRVVAPALVGVVVAAVPVGLAAVAALRFGVTPPAAAAGLVALALAAVPLLPRAALRLAGLPRPLVPADGEELVDADTGPDLLPPDELAERADLARGYLAGLTGGCAALAAVAALPAATATGWTGPVLAGVTVAVLGLRARSYADPAPARITLVSAIAAGIGLAALFALQAGAGGRAAVAAGLLAAAAAGAVTITRTGPIGSPVTRRAIDLLEGLLVAVAVPLALGAMNLFGLVRGL